jgi:hypothetical protein
LASPKTAKARDLERFGDEFFPQRLAGGIAAAREFAAGVADQPLAFGLRLGDQARAELVGVAGGPRTNRIDLTLGGGHLALCDFDFFGRRIAPFFSLR